MPLTITAYTAAALAILIVLLAIDTIRRRVALRAAFGDGADHGLVSAIRAHGNLTEYAPMALILIALLELAKVNAIGLAALAGAFVAARLLHVHGIYQPPGPPNASRSIGIVATLAILLVLAIWLIAVTL